MFADFCKSFRRGFLVDSLHTRADFLLFNGSKNCLLIGHENESHYRSIQKKLQPRPDFEYCERAAALEYVSSKKPEYVIVDDIAHYLFLGESALDLMKWVYQLQQLVLSVS
jgi:hypothetical protein